MSFPARILGIVFSPRTAYADVVRRPTFLGALAVVLLVSMTGTFIFMSTEVGKTALIDQQVRQAESFGRTVNDQAYQRLEQMARFAPYFGAGAQLISLPLTALVIAGIAFAVFNAALGGDATFKQTYAIVAHSGIVIALQQLFVLPLDYARESLSSPTNLAVFLPFLDENTFVSRMLGSIDLFLIWWSISLAIGLGVLYRRRTGSIATTLLVIYGVIALVIAAVKTALAGAS
jgi:Yip1-like protein